MSATSYLKSASIPKIDEFLAYSGLQRRPSMFSRMLGSAGLISLGAIAGAGVALWLGSPRHRRQLSTAISSGIDKVSTKLSEGLDTSPVANNGIASGKQVVAR